MAEAVLSLQMGNKDLDQTKIDRITACFASYGLPTHVPVRAILTELFWLLDADDALAVWLVIPSRTLSCLALLNADQVLGFGFRRGWISRC